MVDMEGRSLDTHVEINLMRSLLFNVLLSTEFGLIVAVIDHPEESAAAVTFLVVWKLSETKVVERVT